MREEDHGPEKGRSGRERRGPWEGGEGCGRERGSSGKEGGTWEEGEYPWEGEGAAVLAPVLRGGPLLKALF